jgi:hypothetical protein
MFRTPGLSPSSGNDVLDEYCFLMNVAVSWDDMTCISADKRLSVTENLRPYECSYVLHWDLAFKNNEWSMNSGGHGLFIHCKLGHGEPSGCVLSLCCLATSQCNSTLSRCYLISVGLILSHRSRDTIVGIATSYGLDNRGRSSSPGRVKNFLFSKSSRPALRSTQPPIQWVPGLFPRG